MWLEIGLTSVVVTFPKGTTLASKDRSAGKPAYSVGAQHQRDTAILRFRRRARGHVQRWVSGSATRRAYRHGCRLPAMRVGYTLTWWRGHWYACAVSGTTARHVRGKVGGV